MKAKRSKSSATATVGVVQNVIYLTPWRRPSRSKEFCKTNGIFHLGILNQTRNGDISIALDVVNDV